MPAVITSGSGRPARALSSLDLCCFMRASCDEFAEESSLAVGRCFSLGH